jgi:uncharacterized protein YciI
MMVMVVCRDAIVSPEARKGALAAHRDYVDANAGLLVLSGPLLGADGQSRTGQLFVLDVPDLAAAHRFVAADPFTQAGVFDEVTVDGFLLVFRDGSRLQPPQAM